MTSDFALNNSMISKEEYLDKKAYYDYQRKVEWNREKCMKICEDLKVLGDDDIPHHVAQNSYGRVRGSTKRLGTQRF